MYGWACSIGVCKIDPIKFKSRIISALRKLSYSWPPRKAVQDRAKRAPATFECENCGVWCYTGKSETKLGELKVTYKDKDIRMLRLDIDHRKPIISVEHGFTDWNDLINGMFCGEDNLWAICKDCHDKKTSKEREERKQNRKKKK